MIKKIRLKNFACHKDSVLELNPGLNIIKGATHNGKSVIHEALGWVLLNNIRGTGFRPITYDVDTKDPSSVEVQFDNGFVLRERDGKTQGVNRYRWETYDKSGTCEALKSSVPDEIFNITRIDEINIQGQEDDRFLISKHTSPGEVAKKLNEFVGLSVIDTVSANAKSNVDGINDEIKKTKRDLLTSQEEVDKLANLDSIEVLITEVDNLILKRNELSSKVQRVAELSNLIGDISQKITDNKEWLECKNFVNELETLLKKGIDLNHKKDEVMSLSIQINNTNKRIEKGKSLLPSKLIIEDIEKQYSQVISLSAKAKQVDNLRSNIDLHRYKIERYKRFLQCKSIIIDIESLCEKSGLYLSLKQKVESVQNNVLKLRAKIQHSKKLLKEKENKLKEVRNSVKECPIFDVMCPLQKG